MIPSAVDGARVVVCKQYMHRIVRSEHDTAVLHFGVTGATATPSTDNIASGYARGGKFEDGASSHLIYSCTREPLEV